MKRLTLTMIVLFSLLAALIVGLIVYGIAAPTGSAVGIIGSADGPTAIFATRENRELLQEQSILAAGLDNISLALGADTVLVLEAEGEDVVIRQYGLNLDTDRLVVIEQNGSALTISQQAVQPNRSFQFGTRNQSWVELYLPAAYSADLRLELSSGMLHIRPALTLQNFSLRLASGDVDSQSLITAQRAAVSCTSGAIHLAELAAERFSLQVASGDMNVEKLAGSGEVAITSGSVRLGDVDIAQRLQAKIASGDLQVALADSPALQFKGKVTSGDIHTYFPTLAQSNGQLLMATVGDAPYKELVVQLTSGQVRITGEEDQTSFAQSAGDAQALEDWEDFEDFEAWD